MTIAASAIAERNTLGQRSFWVATRLQSLNLPNMISIRLRRLYRRLSLAGQGIAQQCPERGALTVFFRCFRPGFQARIPMSFNASLNQSASWPRTPSSQSTSGKLLGNARALMQSLTCPAVTNRSIGRH